MNWKKSIKFIFAGTAGLIFLCFPFPVDAQHLCAPDSNIIKLSSTLWSDLRDIKFHDSKAFCVFYDGLTISDLSNINSPPQIGQVELTPNGQKVDMSGNYAYVISTDSVMHLIDISSVNQPLLRNSFKMPHLPVDIKARDNCAYVATKNAGLLVFDVSDPFNVSLIGSCSVAGFKALSLYLYGNLAYLAGIGGLRLINIVFPYHPFLFGSYDEIAGANKVFVNADSGKIFAYLGNPVQLSIVDVTNPRDIFPLSSYWSTSTMADISVSGDYAYLGLSFRGLLVLDMRDRTSPNEVSALLLGDYTRGIFYFSDFVFVTDHFQPTNIVNVFNPDRPFISGRWIVPGTCKDVVVKDDIAYVMCDHSGLHILNVEDPNHPQVVSTLYAPYNNNGVDVEGDYAYITALLPGMQVVDITDPFNPEIVERYQPDGYTYGVKIKEGYAYLLNAQNDIQIIDVQNPISVIPRGSVQTPGTVQEIFIRGDYVYTADLSAGLTIINMTDKDNPFLVKSVPTVGRCKSVFSSDNLLFLACEEVGMEIYDITDPETPVLVSFYSTSDGIKDLYVEDRYAYLTMENHKIEVVDITSPSTPVLAVSYHLLDNPGNLMVRDEHIYLCDRRSFKILRFLPPLRLPKASAKKM